MKKIAALLFGIALSSSVFADPIAANASQADRTIDTTACTLLTEGVTINLSRDVPAGYTCDTGSNVIAFAACHPNGRKNAAGDNFIYAGSSAGGQITSVGTDGAASPNQSAACTSDAAQTAADGKAEVAGQELEEGEGAGAGTGTGTGTGGGGGG